MNNIARDDKDVESTHVIGHASQSFESTFKHFLKSHCPRCAGQRKVNYLRNFLRKSSNKTVKENIRRLRELVNIAKANPDDMFFPMMPLKWQTKFYETRDDPFDMTFDIICDSIERL